MSSHDPVIALIVTELAIDMFENFFGFVSIPDGALLEILRTSLAQYKRFSGYGTGKIKEEFQDFKHSCSLDKLFGRFFSEKAKFQFCKT